MRDIEGQCPVGTIVFMKETTLPERYGVVVDACFWRKNMQEENPEILENFDRDCNARGPGAIAPIMLLTSTLNRGTNNAVFGGVYCSGKYVRNFIWTSSVYLTGFDSPEEFIAFMEQATHLVGGPTYRYLRDIISFAEEIGRYLKNPNYDTELKELFDYAFPGLKVGKYCIEHFSV